jgi:hypothetical protein
MAAQIFTNEINGTTASALLPCETGMCGLATVDADDKETTLAVDVVVCWV